MTSFDDGWGKSPLYEKVCVEEQGEFVGFGGLGGVSGVDGVY